MEQQDRSNDLMNAMALFSKFEWNDVIAFDEIGDLVKNCGASWSGASQPGVSLGVVSYCTSVAAVHGYTRRQLMDRFKRQYPTGRISLSAAESEQLLVPWAELAAALAFVLLGKDPGLAGMSPRASVLRKEALKEEFWDEIKRRNH